MEPIDEFIKEYDLSSKEFFKYFLDAPDDEINEFTSVFYELLNISYNKENRKRGFNFVANSTLSGLPFPCAEIECRLENISSLARNAILYADTVYVQNPFEKYLEYKEFNTKLRYDFLDDLLIFFNLQPLFRDNVLKFTTSKLHFCNDCYKEFKEEYLKDFDSNFDIVEKLIEEFILDNVLFELTSKDGRKQIEVSGEEDFLKHPFVISFLQYYPPIIEKINFVGEKLKLNSNEVKESGLLYYLVKDFTENLSIQDFYSKYHSAYVLTDKTFDIKLFELINAKTSINDQVAKSEIFNNLNHILPFIDDIPISKLLELRKREGEAFEVYRDKLNKISKKNLTSLQESKDYYLDEIRPEINKINLTIKNNKKLLWGNIKTNLILASTYVSASLYTGILPSNIDKIIASIGGFGFAKTITEDMIKMLKKPSVRDNELYFLWKLQKDNKIKL